MKNIFITGIGTNVGKTVASAVITEALQADYWKPIQTGSNDLTDTQNIKNLISNTKSVIHNESYLFKEPVSPHLAASLENQTIQLSNIVIPNTENNIVIEGAGGILVPINNTHFVIDLANVFDCEIVLVIKNYLGCINHALLSIDYLLNNQYNLKGLILNGNFDKQVKSAILNHSETPIIAEIKEFETIDKSIIKELAKTVNINTLLQD
ncbi:MAG: dethiobiotin synthase [Bacteroidetes bacterium]|uniref:dethiobiotin synthase n=1 Tax=Flavobacterium filum TaxID=370974 RepID=UPI0023F26E64|nr:dethiobiotin synthase [Flavobacterium filum]MCA0429401.1 dethiobiotin synthase [Bacteroidota bacterium]